MKVRLFEIFTSVEGEGILYGTKTLFVRLAGCPFTCYYCDTKESLPMNSGKEYSIEDANQLIDNNLKNQTYKVNFTGGDPLIQHEAVAQLAKHIQMKKIPTYLESSCFDIDRFNHVLPFIDIVKIEFKTKDSEFVDSQHYDKLIDHTMKCLISSVKENKTTYIKIVVSSKTSLDDFRELVNQIFKNISKDDIDGFIIQPTYGISEPSLELLLELYDIVYPHYIDVKVVPQLHKFIGAP
ncbi:MAG: 7-carboxy-7-deazaguanine synthase QueE [Nitrosopumilus sp.]|uniref:7-carboxy-7-deazaguanine synthase QueE n=1 Tax=Nitrosopumilus sp. TaxID=2024843 RepID=UPI00247EEB41|nr:7-carboxy-7-deazaguanine synthase QueE [Nitrosopumilus sp.]MCV0393269.1 7-carboxy-7-deazaguanine synthase QueE [Nitrosopumilus sp.]